MGRIMFVFLVLFLSNLAFAQSPSKDEIKNIFNLSSIDSSQSFVLGEQHFYPSNDNFQLEVFKYLHEKHQLNTWVFEAGKAFEVFWEEYTLTKDSLLLDIMNTYYLLSSTDTNTLIEQIIKFNATLPKNKRIHLQSFDIDYGIHPTLLALKILIIKNKAENNQPWQQLLSFIQEAEKKFTLNPKDKNDKIIHNGYYELKKINSWIDTSLNFIKSDTLYYQKKFKHDFVKLSQLLKSLKDGLVFNFKDYAYREKILTQNIYDLLKNKNQKYMFTTGVAHVMNGFPGAFYLINRDLPPEKMLISICLYNKKQYKKEWKDMGYASSMIKEMKSSLKKNKTNIFKNKFNQRIYSNDSPDADFTFILPVK